MSSREIILGKIRTSLGRDGMDPALRADLEARVASSTPNLIPDRADKDAPARVNLFKAEAERVDASVVRAARMADVPGAVARYLADANLPTTLKAQPTELLKSIPWSDQSTLSVDYGTASDDDAVGVSEAFSGIAETGTLMLPSGPDRPVALNYLPDTHVVVLPASRIERAYEDAFSRLRAGGGDTMPRVLGWVTGPSRTADIEQTLYLGAHGPRRLLIVIVDEEETP